jgi:26S proteasome regulatory subunit T5
MSTVPPGEHPNNNEETSNQNKEVTESSEAMQPESAEMDTTPDQPVEETWDDIPEEIMELETEDVLMRIRLIENDIKVRTGLSRRRKWTKL